MADGDVTHADISKEDFHLALRSLDIAVSEAKAVSQAVGVRCMEANEAYKAWSTYIFMRICINAGIMIGNVPGSRWGKRDYELWDLSLVAPYVRAIIEARLLFYYISKKPTSENEWRAKLNVMHMNDCIKRLELMADSEGGGEFYEEQREQITERLINNEYFNTLDAGTRKRCLAGKAMMLQSRDEILNELGEDTKTFKIYFDFLSHYTHVLPMSYYRAEPNGRGTGCFNEVDFGYIWLAMKAATEALCHCTDIMCELFPDTQNSRKGLKSKFSPGPKLRK